MRRREAVCPSPHPSPLTFSRNELTADDNRTLTVPPEYGYGDRGIGPIPGGATLSTSPPLTLPRSQRTRTN